MSGGYFDYKQYELDNIADNIEQVIRGGTIILNGILKILLLY